MSDITWSRETRKLSQLIPWEHNPRLTRTDQAERMVDSLDIFGQVQTIAIGPDSEIYDGHQRKFVWSAAEQFGPDYEVDVRVSSRELTERERQRLVVYLHRGATGEWDFDTLANGFDVGDLLEWGFEEIELGLAGFDLGNGPEDPGPQIDKAAELQEKWQVQRGQVWQIGRHRLMCGDSTVAEDVKRLSAEAVLMITDPPYGVEYDPMFRQKALGAADRRTGVVAGDDRSLWGDAFDLFLGDVCYVWHADRHAIESGLDLMASGFEIRATIIWKKEHSPYGQGHYNFQHEPCWYGVRKGKTAHWRGDLRDSTIWEIALDKTAEGNHGTQKPVECMARPIRNHEGDVYDPFLGSGTTMVAAQQLGRRCFGMEIHPPYVSVSLERLAGMGLEPELVSDE